MAFSKGKGPGAEGDTPGDTIYKGIIRKAADFPSDAQAQVGWWYTAGDKEFVTSLTSVGTTATATVTSTVYDNFVNGTNIIISNADQSQYNGTFVGTKGATNQITYTLPLSATSPATGAILISTPDTVTDNDPTKTNTGQTFYNSDDFMWNGSSWTFKGPDRIWKDDGQKVSLINFLRELFLTGYFNADNGQFRGDLAVWDDLGVGGSADNIDGQIKIRDRNNVTRFNAEAKNTGISLILNALPAITDILQGVGGSALNNALLTADYFHEHIKIAANTFTDYLTDFGSYPNFTLSHEPHDKENSNFTVNGRRRRYGASADYTITGTTLTWNQPTENGLQFDLTSNDELQITYDYSLTSSSNRNITENGIIIGGYWNGTQWISNNPNLNLILELPDPFVSISSARLSMSHGVAAGNQITDADLKTIWTFEQEKAGRIGYGVASPTIEMGVIPIDNLSTTGSVATVILSSAVSDFKRVGDEIRIQGTTNYNGTHQVTEIPSINTLKFNLAGSFPPETGVGNLVVDYSPQPHHNQHGVLSSSSQIIKVFEHTDLADGYYVDIRNTVGTLLKIKPYGSITIHGILENNAKRDWVIGSPAYPYILENQTVRLRKQKINEWWLEFAKVGET
jgi:hypothetical protein